MTIAILKSIPNQFGATTSYWITAQESVTYLNSPVKLVILGYFDKAAHDGKKQVMSTLPITIPADQVTTALASAASLGAYLLALPQFSGGTIDS